MGLLAKHNEDQGGLKISKRNEYKVVNYCSKYSLGGLILANARSYFVYPTTTTTITTIETAPPHTPSHFIYS